MSILDRYGMARDGKMPVPEYGSTPGAYSAAGENVVAPRIRITGICAHPDRPRSLFLSTLSEVEAEVCAKTRQSNHLFFFTFYGNREQIIKSQRKRI